MRNMKVSRPSGTGNGSKKKMVIKPFKSLPKLPPNFEADSWMKLQSAIQAVHNNSLIDISKEELYRVIPASFRVEFLFSSLLALFYL